MSRTGSGSVHCDNTGKVIMANSAYSKAPQITHSFRCLFFIRVHYQFSMYAAYIEGANNC